MQLSNSQVQKISYLMIELNSSCNLKCTFCNREKLVEIGQRPNKSLSLSEFEKRLTEFKNSPIDTIKIEGISEPMLHPQFDEGAKMIRSFVPNAFVIIATNLQYNIDKTPFLKTLKYVDMVYLSIDGIKEKYEKIRIGSDYNKLLRNLEWIRENLTTSQKKKLHINFTLTKENMNDLIHMYDLRDSYDLSSVRINLAQNWNEDQLNSHKYDKELITFIKKYQKDLKGSANWDYNQCFWPFNGVIVDVYGNIRQCIINTSQNPIGNMLEKPLEEIYNNDYYIKIREDLSLNKCPPSCINCDYKLLSPILSEIFDDKNQNKPRHINR